MLGIVINLPPTLETYLATTPVTVIAAQALMFVGWVPVLGILIWGMIEVWVDYKQGKWLDSLKWLLLEVQVPAGMAQTPKGMENFFANLSGAKSSITWRENMLVGKLQTFFSFEIISGEGRIRFLIRTVDKYQDLVEAALYAQYPEAHITVVEDYVDQIPKDYPNDTMEVFGTEMVLSKKEQFFPIRTYEDFEHQGEKDNRFKDPILPTLEFLGKMGPGEHFWLQIVIQPPDSQDWTKEGTAYLLKMMGKEPKKKKGMLEELVGTAAGFPAEMMKQVTGLELGTGETAEKKADDFKMFKLTPQERETLDKVAEKIAKIAWKTKIRWLYCAPKNVFRKGLVASSGKGIFAPYNHLYLNGLGMHGPSTPKDDYVWQAWQMPGKQKKLVRNFAKRKVSAVATPFMFTVEELASLWHFPAGDARTPVLTAMGARRSEAPAALAFAPEGDESLPNWKMRDDETKRSEVPESETAGLTLPTPSAPTMYETRPEPGKPAPLPPGMEEVLNAPVEMKEAAEVPPNLPV